VGKKEGGGRGKDKVVRDGRGKIRWKEVEDKKMKRWE
jgi:hypothetical protein